MARSCSLESDVGGRYQDMDDAAQHARAREMPTIHRGINVEWPSAEVEH